MENPFFQQAKQLLNQMLQVNKEKTIWRLYRCAALGLLNQKDSEESEWLWKLSDDELSTALADIRQSLHGRLDTDGLMTAYDLVFILGLRRFLEHNGIDIGTESKYVLESLDKDISFRANRLSEDETYQTAVDAFNEAIDSL